MTTPMSREQRITAAAVILRDAVEQLEGQPTAEKNDQAGKSKYEGKDHGFN